MAETPANRHDMEVDALLWEDPDDLEYEPRRRRGHRPRQRHRPRDHRREGGAWGGGFHPVVFAGCDLTVPG